MSVYLIEGEILQDIADAVREKKGGTEAILAENMASEIRGISGGSTGGVSKLAKYADGTLTEITAEDLNGVKTISNYKFQYLTSLVSVEIPEGVESIGFYCFMECGSNLSVVTLPSTLKRMDSGCFSFCGGISVVRVKAKTPPTMDWGCFDMAYNAFFVVDEGCASDYKSNTNWSAFADRIVETNQSMWVLRGFSDNSFAQDFYIHDGYLYHSSTTFFDLFDEGTSNLVGTFNSENPFDTRNLDTGKSYYICYAGENFPVARLAYIKI